MNFYNDLKLGEKMELEIMEFLNKHLGYEFIKNTNKMGVDLICNKSGKTAEVKFDRMCDSTGNYAFEFNCNGKDSGILKDSDLWIQSHSKGFEIYNRLELLEFIRDNYDREVKGGDGWRSRMWLIKKDKVTPLAELKYNL